MSDEAKCSCQFCNGHIAFPEEMAGQMTPCPHCGLETMLHVPLVSKFSAITASSNPSKNVRVETKRGVSPLGIGSLVLGIIACIFCWIPLLGLLAIPLALIGLFLAFVGVVMAGINRKSGFIFPISGGVVCMLSVLMALAITGAFSRLLSSAMEQTKRTNQEQGAEPVNRENTPGTNKTLVVQDGQEPSIAKNDTFPRQTVEEWARTRSVKQGDINVAVYGVHLGSINFIDVVGLRQSTKDELLTIELAVANSSLTKKVDFRTWRGVNFGIGATTVNLTDNYQNAYKRIDITPQMPDGSSFPDDASIHPQKQIHDLLVFELPVENIQWLHLELPAKNFGGSGMLRIEIPMRKVMTAWREVRQAKAEREAFWATNPTMNERMRVQGGYHKRVDAAEARLKAVETNLLP